MGNKWNKGTTKFTNCSKKAVPIVTGSIWNAHTKPLFAKLNILTLHDIHKLQVACCMFKVYNEPLPAYFLSMFSTNSEKLHYSSRQSSRYLITFHRTTLLKYNSYFRNFIMECNARDPSIKESATVDKYKCNVKTSLLGAAKLVCLNDNIRFSYIIAICLLQAYLCEHCFMKLYLSYVFIIHCIM